MQRTQYDGEHEYLVSPESVGDYPITDNETHSTYDQFIQLRDTLIFSGKYYNDKAWAKLIVWASKETIEVIFKNRFKLSFEPWYNEDVANKTSLQSEWPYVTWLASDPSLATLYTTYWPLACIINQDWHYSICHKEEIWAWSTVSQYEQPIPATTTQILCQVLVYEKMVNGQYPPTPDYETAVFDWMAWDNQTLWDMFKKITSFWYNERDLKKDDILVLKCVDQDWNELPYQSISNFFQVQYIDLPKDN